MFFKSRIGHAILLGALSIFMLSFGAAFRPAFEKFYAEATTSVPHCDSADVLALANRVVKGNPFLALSANILGSSVEGISFPAEEGYDAQHERRSCRAVISIAGIETPVHYTVAWHDKSQGLIQVQFTTRSPATSD